MIASSPFSAGWRSELPRIVVDEAVTRALAEDLAGGDVTTEACISAESRSVARAVARKGLVVAGLVVAERAFHLVDPSLEVELLVADGALVPAGTPLLRATGSSRSLLMAERVALNFMQRMSGVATVTRRYVDALTPGSPTRVTDTRKTTPGLRALERYAVRCGGGKNHRDNLGSAILIKDNHIAACGGVANAIARAKARSPHTSKIECEVDTLAQLAIALDAGADIVLLDNMDDGVVAEAIAHNRAHRRPAVLEASGGITLERIAALSALGIDAISVGALTHSAVAVDIGLDFDAA